MGLAVAADRVVCLSYDLFDQAGTLVGSTKDSGPVEYVHGYGQVLPGLERGVEGAAVGERRELHVEPADAFGEHDPEGIMLLDGEGLPEGIAAGDEITAEIDGHTVIYKVLELVDGEDARAFKVDTNHPLAGHRVRFDVKVESVRAASDEEIENAREELEEGCGCGESHGPGHQHGSDDVVPAASLTRSKG